MTRPDSSGPAATGFEVLEASIETEPEDRHDARFLWVVARRSDASRG